MFISSQQSVCVDQRSVCHDMGLASYTHCVGVPSKKMAQTVPAGLLFTAISEAKITQAEFARRIDETAQTITNWKARGIPWEKVATVAAALGLTIDQYVTHAAGKLPATWRWTIPPVGAELTQSKNSIPVHRVIATGESSPATYSIPLLEVGGSMGAGRLQPEQETVVGAIDVNQHWVRRNLPDLSSPRNLRVITGYGDSMESTYHDGDILFVDTGYKEVRLDAVYAFELNNELFIKRLQRRPDGTLTVISDNNRYPPYTINAREKMRVIGRVVGGWNWRKL